jgi:DNA topoisomerase I
MFNEITANAVKKAFEQPARGEPAPGGGAAGAAHPGPPGGLQDLAAAVGQGAARFVAGRVQTVALRLIVEREREVRRSRSGVLDHRRHLNAAQKPPVLTPGWRSGTTENVEIDGRGRGAGDPRRARWRHLHRPVGGTREKKRNPVPPFITSTLQQEASRKLRFSVKRTMMLAQRLYEGVELGAEGAVGLITYMRTDSTRVSNDALARSAR